MRISSIEGWYLARQESAKAKGSTVRSEFGEEGLDLAGDAGAPIDHRAEYVEEQRFDHRGHEGRVWVGA